jgi:hypothetical protein
MNELAAIFDPADWIILHTPFVHSSGQSRSSAICDTDFQYENDEDPLLLAMSPSPSPSPAAAGQSEQLRSEVESSVGSGKHRPKAQNLNLRKVRI